MSKSKIYLFPIPIVENYLQSLPEVNHSIIKEVKYFVVERIRTSRRFLKSVDSSIDIDAISFIEMDKHNDYSNLDEYKSWLSQGLTIGIMSESGVPCIGDPGHKFVSFAYEMGAKVIPLVGPSSILLSLMGSGLNGQCFQFDGYLPVKEPALKKSLSEMEQEILKTSKTFIFIEAPYRIKKLFDVIIKHCHKDIKLCVAEELDGPDAWIQTKYIREWHTNDINSHKRNVIFLLGK
jgi:16S rRNA (cytidine1402-2'-O)-methyltransferase